MRVKIYLSLFLISFFMLLCQNVLLAEAETPAENETAAAAVSEKVVVENIKEVKIINNKIVSTPTIRSKLRTTESALFSQEILNEDLKRLYEMGFFEDIAIDVKEEPDGYIVSFIVLEKPLVEGVFFKGNKAMPEAKLKTEISTKADDMLDLSKLNRDLTVIRKLYESQGYQLANVDYTIQKDEELNRATVTFNVNEKQRIRVKSITFAGNYSVKPEELSKLMVTKTEFLFFIQPGYFKTEEFENDMETLRAYYQSMGYLDVGVEPEFDYNADGTQMYITVKIDEGKKYVVGDIAITGAEKFPEFDIRNTLRMTPGKPYSELAMREDIVGIQQFYYDKGYMSCDITPDALLDAATGNINISYAITEGELIYVDKVRILGNTKTRDIVIRRELRAYPGEPFNGSQIRRSKERLYNLGYFEDVVFNTESGSAPDKKDLNVSVKETKTGEFSFGGGYSSIDRLIGFVQIEQRNFDLLNFPTFTGGGQNLNVRAELGMVRQNYVVSWTDPWILGFPYLFGFDFYRTEHARTTDLGYLFDEARTGGDFRLGKEFTEHLRADAMYKLELVDISNVHEDAAQDIKNEDGKNWLSRLFGGIRYDTRDNVYVPTRGFLLGGSLENVGGFLGGDKNFLKYGADGEIYFNFFEKRIVLMFVTSLDLIQKYGDTSEVPIYERFYAGGATTIRGYKERYVTPRDSATNEPLGGNARFLATLEATFPVFEDLIKGALFADSGNVWKGFSDLDAKLRYSIGAGVRIKTPLGPVKLDYGWPLTENYGDAKRGRFYFSMAHGF
ncbi:MAG: outer membrane protein assembly factor BamA [Candidatus Omnitrophica bacterium]|nr:outer membrane protein assembly factor BamA [Candidatus Omnitrophota bacterium]MBU4488236.1 outer membrane protein assembly factor BamA [Candidatus Omnitrophota bacterium]MCG2704684.1 outer membrane protein assembly factor BamA [Candidatus Omnitrophota bacterium]